MYIYQITNLINNKIYIGQTNDIAKRWSNHRCCNSPNMVIARAIKKYGVENFKFEVLFSGLTPEEADKKEVEIIKEKNSRVPNGYNVAIGGHHNNGISRYGSDNNNAHLSQEEAQYILDHRDIPMYVLYDDYSEKLSYESFKKIYHHITYKNLQTSCEEYPYNSEFSNQFTSGNTLDYGEVIQLRTRYANGEYWLDVYKDFKDKFQNQWCFWNVYYGNSYKLVMPEVFTEENRKKHSSLGKRGIKNGRAKLSEQDVLKIRKLHNDGIPNSDIYKKFPQVSKTNIRDIINNKTWTYLL